MIEPIWIEKEALLLLHAKGLSRFGGADGLRDEGLLDSVLARPVDVFHYKPDADLATLAAAYAFGLVKNRSLLDGNKRVAFLAVGLFLEFNGWRLEAAASDAISAVVALASSAINETEFAAWVRVNARQL